MYRQADPCAVTHLQAVLPLKQIHRLDLTNQISFHHTVGSELQLVINDTT